jgi:hypothetical protein
LKGTLRFWPSPGHLMAQNENSTRPPSTIIEKANSAAQSTWGNLWPAGHTGEHSPIMVN